MYYCNLVFFLLKLSIAEGILCLNDLKMKNEKIEKNHIKDDNKDDVQNSLLFCGKLTKVSFKPFIRKNTTVSL